MTSTRNSRLECLIAARMLVAEQAEDEGLWIIPATAVEEYLQAALMRLHEAIEGWEAEEHKP
jgi:hypothetical protein